MRAVVHDRYGPPEVLHLQEVERPVPKDDEILVRIRATSVTRSDAHLRSGSPFVQRVQSGLMRPKRRILGHELAGDVVAVGADVSEFEVGDRVFGALPYLALRAGAYAELIAVPARWPLVPIPEGMSFDQVGAITDGYLCALNGYRPAGSLEGKDVLVYGASGSIGTAAVQLAKHFGARVTAVCNTKNVELVRSLGADEVIDYLQDDFTGNGKTYDVIFDAVGKRSFRGCKSSLRAGGFYLPTDGFRNLFLWLWHKRFGDRKVVFEIPRFRKQDVLLLKELLERGKYRPVIDRTYPLEDVVEATRYVETQQKTGNVVLTVDGGEGVSA
jgi:NADPH:quinone reductase-like Zn-dependent oxidoreductase